MGRERGVGGLGTERVMRACGLWVEVEDVPRGLPRDKSPPSRCQASVRIDRVVLPSISPATSREHTSKAFPGRADSRGFRHTESSAFPLGKVTRNVGDAKVSETLLPSPDRGPEGCALLEY